MYRVEYKYETGDSFGSDVEYGTLDVSFSSLDLAKKALKDIKEHYEFYREARGYRNYFKSQEEINNNSELAKLKSWFVNTEGCLKLLIDEGKYYQFHAPWCGYFESLISAKIIDDDMEIEL